MKKIFKMVLTKNQYKDNLLKKIKVLLINCVSNDTSLLKDKDYTTVNLSLPNTHVITDRDKKSIIYISKYDTSKNSRIVGNDLIMVTYDKNTDELYIFNYFNKSSYCKLNTLPFRHLETIYHEMEDAF